MPEGFHQTCPAGAGHPGPERWSAYFFRLQNRGPRPAWSQPSSISWPHLGHFKASHLPFRNQKAPLSPKRQRRTPLRYHSHCRGYAAAPRRPVTGPAVAAYCWFSGTLGGDLPGPSLSALHQYGGSLRRGGDGTRPLLSVFPDKNYSETRKNRVSEYLTR